MKLLLDTHTFIWWDSNPDRLSAHVLTLFEDCKHTLLVSVASLWEMQIKIHLGKIKLKLSIKEIIKNQQETNGIEVLPISLNHVLELENLPAVHKDPFDRLLIAQANAEQAALVSSDAIFSKYPVKVIW